MKKSTALNLFGGTARATADALGITASAVHQWPDDLPDAVRDRIQAHIARRRLKPETIGEEPKEKAATE